MNAAEQALAAAITAAIDVLRDRAATQQERDKAAGALARARTVVEAGTPRAREMPSHMSRRLAT